MARVLRQDKQGRYAPRLCLESLHEFPHAWRTGGFSDLNLRSVHICVPLPAVSATTANTLPIIQAVVRWTPVYLYIDNVVDVDPYSKC